MRDAKQMQLHVITVNGLVNVQNVQNVTECNINIDGIERYFAPVLELQGLGAAAHLQPPPNPDGNRVENCLPHDMQ